MPSSEKNSINSKYFCATLGMYEIERSYYVRFSKKKYENISKIYQKRAALLELRCQRKSREDNRFPVKNCMKVCSIGKN